MLYVKSVAEGDYDAPEEYASQSVKCSNVSTPTTIADVLTASLFTATKASYSDFTDVTVDSGAVYAGNSAKTDAGAIQLRSDKSTSGIVTTTSGGKVKKVVITWDTKTTKGRTLNIYGSNTVYSKASDLYDSEKSGTLIGTIVNDTSTELEISDDYKYIGMKSKSGAMYITSITIVWEK